MKTIRNPVMMLITAEQYKQLKEAGPENMKPIVKLFIAQLTWLVTQIDESGILWGYADIGMQCVEYGTLCHEDELPTMKVGPFYLERDRSFKHKEGAKYLELDSLSGI